MTTPEIPVAQDIPPRKSHTFLGGRYEVWKDAMLLLRSQCKHSVALLSANLPFRDISFRDFGIMDQERYETIQTSRAVRWSWFFRLDFQKDTRCVRYLFYFSPHDLNPQVELPNISLRVGREDPPNSSLYVRCDLNPAQGDPDILGISYNPSDEVFCVDRRERLPQALKVDTIVREIVQQIVQRNFMAEV